MRTIVMGLACLIFLFTLACGTDDGPAGIPELTVSGQQLAESNGADVTHDLTVSLSIPAPADFTLRFSTQDLSAKAGVDYIAIPDGSINVPMGSSSVTIPVTIVSDLHFELKESFLLIFEEDDNYQFNSNTFVSIANDDSIDDFEISEDNDGYFTPIEYPSMELIWSDEFEAEALNESDWNYELGDGCPDLCGWGNNELEFYTDAPENIALVDGKLIITAIKNEDNPTYTSARITTAAKQEFRFGRIDIRAKLPEGQGIWPAFWMLGANINTVGWPSCGEIDIMEMVGHEPDFTHGTVHFQGVNGYEFTGKEYQNPEGDFIDKYHVWTIIWDQDFIKWYVDYNFFNQVSTTSLSRYPFNNDFFFIVNCAVGGNWPGSPDETTVFPQTLEVDYIRVFQ